MQKMIIGVVNSAIGASNMGCTALIYSLIHLLDRICQEHALSSTYYLFDIGCTDKDKTRMCDAIGLQDEKVKVYSLPHVDKRSFVGRLKTVKHTKDNRRVFDAMSSCAFLVDLTQGDSFSDIYGSERFYRWTDIKKTIEDKRLPLILGPQTYGPFSDDRIRDYAIRVIEGAKAVISRDQTSADYMGEYSNTEIVVGTDLAFELPYSKNCVESNGRIKVGINPSGLLCKKKIDLSAFSDELNTDYESYLIQLINWLKDEGKYEIHMISHVGDEAIECFGGIQGVIYHEAFSTPVEAKSFISGMDVFIGARMHATIAAFSSGVPVIPTAYSRKFLGLYSGVGYENIIDLRKLSTQQSVEKTIEYLRNVDGLRKDVISSREQIDIKRKVNYSFFERIIMDEAN